MGYPFSQPQATIANGASLSGAFYVGAGELVAVDMPAAWTAAALTFQASVDGVTFQDLYDEAGNEVTVAVQPSQHVAIGEGGGARAEHFRGAPYMKVRSGPAGAAVAQGAARVLTFTVRKQVISPG